MSFEAEQVCFTLAVFVNSGLKKKKKKKGHVKCKRAYFPGSGEAFQEARS